MKEHRRSKLIILYLLITTLGIITCDAKRRGYRGVKQAQINDAVNDDNLDGFELEANNENNFDNEIQDIITDIEIETPVKGGVKGANNKKRKVVKKVKEDIPEEVPEIEDEGAAELEEELEGEPAKKTSLFVKIIYGLLIVAGVALLGACLILLYTNYCKFWINKLKNMIAGRMGQRGGAQVEGNDAALLTATDY